MFLNLHSFKLLIWIIVLANKTLKSLFVWFSSLFSCVSCIHAIVNATIDFSKFKYGHVPLLHDIFRVHAMNIRGFPYRVNDVDLLCTFLYKLCENSVVRYRYLNMFKLFILYISCGIVWSSYCELIREMQLHTNAPWA